MIRPKDLQLIGDEVAIAWEDGAESFIPGSTLRAASPSAETAGERDIFGVQRGGETGRDYSQVKVVSWQFVGAYAVRFRFSDGHATGIYSYDLLRSLGERAAP